MTMNYYFRKWLFYILFLITCLNSCTCQTNKKHLDTSYENKIMEIITKEKAIIDGYNFQDNTIKKRLYDVILLGFCVHTWELYSYKNSAIERMNVVNKIESIIINDLKLTVDQHILEKMKDKNSIDQSMALVPEVKDYFIRIIQSSEQISNTNLEADIYMFTVSHLFLALGFDGLLTGIEYKNEQSINTGKKILETGIHVIQDYAYSKQLMRRVLENQLMINITSRIQTGLLNNREKVDELEQEVEIWFNNIIEFDLSKEGFNRK